MSTRPDRGSAKRRKTTPSSSRARKAAKTGRTSIARELGYYDDSGITGFDTTANSTNVAYLNQIANGTTDSQRVGRKIQLKSLQVHGRAYNLSTASGNKCCIMVIWDSKPRGTLPAMTDILQSANSLDFPNPENFQRFTILKRMDFVLVGNYASATNATQITERTIDFFIDLKGRTVVYGSAGTGAVGDIEEGALYLVTTGSSSSGTNAASFSYNTRVRFWDM